MAVSLQGLPTPSIDWHSDDTRAFAKFKELVQLLLEGPLASIGEEVKVKYLLLWVGEEGRDLVKT